MTSYWDIKGNDFLLGYPGQMSFYLGIVGKTIQLGYKEQYLSLGISKTMTSYRNIEGNSFQISNVVTSH